MSIKCWIGLVEVIDNSSRFILGAGIVGFTNICALAETESQYKEIVEKALLSEGLRVLKFDDCEPLEQRIEGHDVEEELLEIAGRLTKSSPVGFGTFHTYEA